MLQPFILTPGVAASRYATVSCCDQLFCCDLNILLTNVPDIVRVAVVASIDNSDHSHPSAVISMAQAVPNLCVRWKVFLKHQVNWNTVCGAIQVECYVPTKIFHVHKKDKPWFDGQCRRAFELNQMAHLGWTSDHSLVNWEEFVRCQIRDNETYLMVKRRFRVRIRNDFMNAQLPHKCLLVHSKV